MEGLWAFLLTELGGGHTRLVISGYQAMRPRWLERFFNYWLYMPVTWPMQVRMLAVLKRNIERAATQPLLDGRPASRNTLYGRDPTQLHEGSLRVAGEARAGAPTSR
jgi:hypothetical protein